MRERATPSAPSPVSTPRKPAVTPTSSKVVPQAPLGSEPFGSTGHERPFLSLTRSGLAKCRLVVRAATFFSLGRPETLAKPDRQRFDSHLALRRCEGHLDELAGRRE